jgi:serine protease
VHFPANVNVAGVLTVGASDRDDLKSFYSPLGNPASPNNQVLDVTAPSHRAYPNQIAGETLEAWTIDIPGNTGYNPWPQFTTPGGPPSVVPPAIGEQLPNAGMNFQAYTGRFGGTSHSCPIVAGVAALMLSANPNLTQQQVFDIVNATANRVGGYVYTNGRSNELGFGRVNACNALLEAYRVDNQIIGNGLVCSTANYSLQNAPNPNRISWSSGNPTGLSINATTGSATRLNNFSGSVFITATINSGCGAVNITRSVWVGTPHITNMRVNNMPYFTGMNMQVCPGNNWLNVTPVGGNVGNASWTVPSGISNWAGTNTLDFNYPQNYSNSLAISVRASNSCGQGPNFNFFLSKKTFGCNSSFGLIIYPNPPQDQFSVELKAMNLDVSIEDAPLIESAILLNNEGKQVAIGSRNGPRFEFNVSHLRKGIYFVHVLIEGELTREQILID